MENNCTCARRAYNNAAAITAANCGSFRYLLIHFFAFSLFVCIEILITFLRLIANANGKAQVGANREQQMD